MAQSSRNTTNGMTSNVTSIPLTFNDIRIQSVELLSQLSDLVTSLTASLSDVHAYYAKRTLTSEMTSERDELRSLLDENVAYIKPIEESFQGAINKILDGSGNGNLLVYFKPMSESIKNYVEFCYKAEQLVINQHSAGGNDEHQSRSVFRVLLIVAARQKRP